MSVIQRTAQTEQDLIEIWIYIAQNNPEAADRVLDDIDERFHALADNPLQQPKLVLPYPSFKPLLCCKSMTRWMWKRGQGSSY